MEREALLALDKPALVELILRLQQEQAAVVAELRQEVAELRARLGQDSSNSSRPPSSDPPGTRAQRRAGSPPPVDLGHGGGAGSPGIRGTTGRCCPTSGSTGWSS